MRYSPSAPGQKVPRRQARRFQVVLVDAGTPGARAHARDRVLALLRGLAADLDEGASPQVSALGVPTCGPITPGGHWPPQTQEKP